MTRLALLAAAALLLALPTTPAADTAPPPRAAAARPGGEPIDVLYLSDARLVVVRLRVASDDRPLPEHWDKFVVSLFNLLDADKSGSLDTKEVAKVRPTVALLTGRAGLPPVEAARTAGPGTMTREGLAEYLRRADLGPFRVPPGADPTPRGRQPRIVRGGSVITTEELDKGLIELLDTDKDGKLSRAELAAAPDILAQFDADENEMLTPEEVLRRPPPLPFFVQQIDDGSATPSMAELALLPRKGADSNLARRLLFRYGTPPTAATTPPGSFSRPRPATPTPAQPAKRRLTQKDIKLTQEVFDALDQDGDGELDSEELARFGENAAPEIEIALRFGSLPAGAKPVEVNVPGKGPVTAFAVADGSEAALEIPGVRLDLVPSRASDFTPGGFRQAYLNRFRIQDRDGNGYLEMNEIGSDVVLRELFPFLDRDGDGKLFEKELTAALTEVEGIAAAATRAMVSTEITEAGRGLFGLIDTDADGRLSPRELRGMVKLIDRFDRDKDGLLSATEVPRRFRAVFTRGPAIASTPSFAVPVSRRMDGQPTPRPKVGPMWFQKMDRNQDGDVSRREFLGTDEDFRRLDADGDGLIDAKEAAAKTDQR